MKLVLISDLHERLPDLTHLKYDGVIIAGDLSFQKYMDLDGENEFYINKMIPWVTSLKGPVFGIYGNHDHFAELHPYVNWIFGRNNRFMSFGSDEELFGIKINGLAYTLPFCEWAFQSDERRLKAMLDNLGKCDILVTHGPPYGIADLHDGRNLGSKAVLRYIEDYSPRVVVTGHIHSGRGIYKYNDTTIVSCSIVDEQYKPINQVMILDLDDYSVIDCNI